jgi:hypothetical protein
MEEVLASFQIVSVKLLVQVRLYEVDHFYRPCRTLWTSSASYFPGQVLYGLKLIHYFLSRQGISFANYREKMSRVVS